MSVDVQPAHPLFRPTSAVLGIKHLEPVHLNEVWSAVEQQALSEEVAQQVKDYLVRLGTALGYAAQIADLKNNSVLARSVFFAVEQVNLADPRA